MKATIISLLTVTILVIPSPNQASDCGDFSGKYLVNKSSLRISHDRCLNLKFADSDCTNPKSCATVYIADGEKHIDFESETVIRYHKASFNGDKFFYKTFFEIKDSATRFITEGTLNLGRDRSLTLEIKQSDEKGELGSTVQQWQRL